MVTDLAEWNKLNYDSYRTNGKKKQANLYRGTTGLCGLRQQTQWKAGLKCLTAGRGLNESLYMTGEIPAPLFSLGYHHSAHITPNGRIKEFFIGNQPTHEKPMHTELSIGF